MTGTDAPVVGWLGLGIMGEAMCTRLVNAGHRVVVWNRTASKCAPLVALGAEAADSPADVIARAKITFGMLADPTAAVSAALEGEQSVVAGVRASSSSGGNNASTEKKMYVDMSTVDAETSARIGAAVTEAGGLFLEAPVSGSKGPAQQGQLVIMASGDRSVFDAAADPYFAIMGKKALHLSDEVGSAAKMKLVVNGVMGSMMAAFCEGNALARATGLRQADLAEILGLGAMACPMFALKAASVQERSYPPAFPLKHQQKDLRLALALGDSVGQPTPVAAAANELYKSARAMGRGDDDFAAVYEAVVVDNVPGADGKQEAKRVRA